MNSMTEGALGGPESKPAVDTSAGMQSAGTRLRLAREAAGMTLDDVAQQLKLARRQVVALESDDVAALPGPTFVRGFIRNYARLLKIDAAPLVESSRPQGTPAATGATASSSTSGATTAPVSSTPAVAPTMSVLPMEPPRQGAGIARWLIPLALVLLLAAGAGYYQFGGGAGALRNSEKSARNAASESARNLPSESDPNTVGAGGSGSGSNAVMGGSAIPASASGAMAPGTMAANSAAANAGLPNATSNPGAANNPARANANAANASAGVANAGAAPTSTQASSTMTASGELPEGRLEFEFAGQAWVEVRDKHGDILISRTMPAKTKHMLRGEPPFTLRVGNASAVSVVLDGRPVDLMPYTRNEIAKLVIPAPNP